MELSTTRLYCLLVMNNAFEGSLAVFVDVVDVAVVVDDPLFSFGINPCSLVSIIVGSTRFTKI